MRRRIFEEEHELFRTSFRQFAAKELGKPVPTGVFGANMQVRLVNDGPVTICLDSRQRE